MDLLDRNAKKHPHICLTPGCGFVILPPRRGLGFKTCGNCEGPIQTIAIEDDDTITVEHPFDPMPSQDRKETSGDGEISEGEQKKLFKEWSLIKWTEYKIAVGEAHHVQ